MVFNFVFRSIFIDDTRNISKLFWFLVRSRFRFRFRILFFVSLLLLLLLLHLQWRPQAIVFEIVTDKKFDIIIMLFIGLNMFTMTLDRYDASDTYNAVLDYLNAIFVVIFSSECLLKIFALRYHYFIEPWNLFDVVVVILSILGK